MAITEHTNPARILVAGCGALGGMIARELSHDHQVFGLRRTPAAVPASVTPVGADLLDPEALAHAVPENLDAIVYCLTPSRYDDDGYQAAYVTGLQNLLNCVQPAAIRQLIFVSSTSVYHQNDDSWVNEDSPTQPVRFSGQCILAGEQLAQRSGMPGTAIRFSGIYGPTRRRFLESIVNGELAPASPSPYSNRIHDFDAASAVAHLMRKALRGETLASCYLASDCEPVRLDEVAAWVRRQTPCADPISEARTGGRAGSKRCDNQRLLDTGFTFRYPDYRAGYGEIILNSAP